MMEYRIILAALDFVRRKISFCEISSIAGAALGTCSLLPAYDVPTAFGFLRHLEYGLMRIELLACDDLRYR
jgi:hypothetical protein